MIIGSMLVLTTDKTLVDRIAPFANTTTSANGLQYNQNWENVSSFDVIVLDITTTVDAEKIWRQITLDYRLRHLPVLLVTSPDNLSDIDKYLRMGARDYLVYPFSDIMLQTRLKLISESEAINMFVTFVSYELKTPLASIMAMPTYFYQGWQVR